jgi:PRTRC genetic system ThiF family protein
MTDMTLPKTFDPHFHPQEIVLVGAGGTGSHAARLIARLLVHLKALRMNVPTFRIVDPDVVESKNIGRQLFAPAELGLAKAEAIARRLSCAFGLPIEWSNEPFEAERHVANARSTILIDAVDHHVPRQAFAQLSSTVVIACGNERSYGQVSIGNVSNPAEMERYLKEVDQKERKLGDKNTLMSLPTAYVLFPSLLEPEPPLPQLADTASCAERVLLGEQDGLMNDTVALIAARYVQQLLMRQPIQSFLTFCTLEEMITVKPVPITLANIRRYLA